jgi:hypothetical protein
LFVLFVRIQHFAHLFCHVTAGNQEDDDEEDEDFSINESGEEGESLGFVDTDIEENKVDDLQADPNETCPLLGRARPPRRPLPSLSMLSPPR